MCIQVKINNKSITNDGYNDDRANNNGKIIIEIEYNETHIKTYPKANLLGFLSICLIFASVFLHFPLHSSITFF